MVDGDVTQLSGGVRVHVVVGGDGTTVPWQSLIGTGSVWRGLVGVRLDADPDQIVGVPVDMVEVTDRG